MSIEHVPVVGKSNERISEIRKNLIGLCFRTVPKHIDQYKSLITSDDKVKPEDIELIRYFQEIHGLFVDGIFGPKSEYLYNTVINEKATHAPGWAIRGDKVNPKYLVHFHNSDISRVFGKADRKGRNIHRFKPELKMVYSWNHRLKVKYIKVNKLIVGQTKVFFYRINSELDAWEKKKLGLDQYGGDFSYRNIGGTDVLSSHAYAISFDFNPLGNPREQRPSKTTFGKHPNIALKFFQIAYECGFRTLADDLMHFQCVEILDL